MKCVELFKKEILELQRRNTWRRAQLKRKKIPMYKVGKDKSFRKFLEQSIERDVKLIKKYKEGIKVLGAKKL